MAPDLALRRLRRVGRERRHVLDPMMGSGTIPVLAALRGHKASGFDVDPLALLIARTWGRPLDGDLLVKTAESVAGAARAADETEVPAADPETRAFIDYWFDPLAQKRLAALAQAISGIENELQGALWCVFSRLIITKDAGASRARDVSHSRPHRVRDEASFDPIRRFAVAARDVARRHHSLTPTRPRDERLRLERADARELPLDDESVDVAMTSPPYLAAIDYLRGHRLSLVWMGYSLADLRVLRGAAIGSERGTWQAGALEEIVDDALPPQARPRTRAVLRRYVEDLDVVLNELVRVLRPRGQLTLVIADSTLYGAAIALGPMVERLARRAGLRRTGRHDRPLSEGRRYLPPPMNGSKESLDRRMRSETCLIFRRL